MAQYDVISFLSDLGIEDESVGVCKAIMMQQAPSAQIVDITHQIKPFDVRQGALALTRAIQFLPSGVVLAAVDPGAPRDQRYIAVELENSIFVGPDNGILAPAAQLLGEPIRVHELTNPEYRIEAPGGVFAARDIMAPAAGVIASGVDIAELGNAIPLEQLVPGMLQLSRHDEGGAFLGEVWSVDRFENIQTNITPEEMTATGLRLGDTVIVRIGQNDFMVKFVERYADLQKSQLGLLVDSTGMLSIAKNLDFAARELGVSEGSALAIMPQGATITGRDITVEAVQAMAPVPAPAPEQAIFPVAPIAVTEDAQEDNSSSAQGVPAPIAPAPVQYEAPISPVAPLQNEAQDAVIPETTPIAFEVTLPTQAETIPEPISVQYETPSPQPLEYDVPTPMPDPVFEPTQNSGSFSSTPAPLETERAQESNPYSQQPVVLPPHPLDQPVQAAPPADPIAPAPVQYEAPQVQAPHPLDQTPAPAQSEVAQNVFSSPTYVPRDQALAPTPAPVAENRFIDQFAQQAPAPTPVAPSFEPAPAPVQYEAPAAPVVPVQYEGSVQPQTYVQEPVAPLQPVAPQQEPQIPMPPHAQPATQAPAPQAPSQPVDQIPSGNVFDLFKIDAESDTDNGDPFSPAKQ